MILRAARSRGRWGEIGQESRGVKTLINAGMETCFSLSLSLCFVQIGIRLARLHSGELKWIYVTRYGHVKSPNVTMCVNLSKQGIDIYIYTCVKRETFQDQIHHRCSILDKIKFERMFQDSLSSSQVTVRISIGPNQR